MKHSSLLLVSAVTLALSACGGGGGSAGSTPPPPPPVEKTQAQLEAEHQQILTGNQTTNYAVSGDGYTNPTYKVSTQSGEAAIKTMEFGQVVLMSPASPYFTLVAERDVLVRVFVNGDRAGLQAPKLKLTFTPASSGQPTTVLLNATGALPLTEKGPDLNRSYVYRWVKPAAGNYAVRAEIDTATQPQDDSANGNVLDQQIVVRPALHLRAWDVVRVNFPGQPEITEQNTPLLPLDEVKERLFQYLPVSSIRSVVRGKEIPYPAGKPTPKDFAEANLEFTSYYYQTVYNFDGENGPWNYHIFHTHQDAFKGGPAAGFGGGIGLSLVTYHFGSTLTAGFWSTLLHEVGHMGGMKHVDGCGTTFTDYREPYPYADGKIGTWGIQFGANGYTVINPAMTYESMTYCITEQFRWTSDYAVKKAYEEFARKEGLIPRTFGAWIFMRPSLPQANRSHQHGPACAHHHGEQHTSSLRMVRARP